MKAQGYNHHILPILDEFCEQNQEKMLVEDNLTQHAAIDSMKARKTRTWIQICQSLRILTTLKIYGVA